MTVSVPFSAPAWPPETGASTKCAPALGAPARSSRATSAEAVVWSTRMPPGGRGRRGCRRRPGDLAHVVVVADAGEDDLGAVGRLARASRRRRRRGALDPGLAPCSRRPVVDRHLVALAREVPGHRKAHHAQPDEGHPHPLSPPGIAGGSYRAAGTWRKLWSPGASNRSALRLDVGLSELPGRARWRPHRHRRQGSAPPWPRTGRRGGATARAVPSPAPARAPPPTPRPPLPPARPGRCRISRQRWQSPVLAATKEPQTRHG